MKLSTTAAYAIQACAFLSKHTDVVSAASIAEKLNIPQPYLRQILRNLARAGVLNCRRGRDGGFQLKIHPLSLSLLQIIEAASGDIVAEIPAGMGSGFGSRVLLALDDATKQVRIRLAAISLQRML